MSDRAPAAPRSVPDRLRRWSGPALNLGVWLAGAAVFFRAQWESGFRNLMGNAGDNALIAYLLEHWFTVLHGRASWANPPLFWPVKGVLGWSDGLVLFELVYTPLRFMGCDPFLAAQLTIVASSLVGFLSFVALMRLLFSPPRWLALAGGLVFTFGNDLWVHSDHEQLLGIWLVPLVVLIGVLALRATSARAAVALGALFGLVEGLFFFTSYYVAWFCLPAAAVALVAAALVDPRRFAGTVHRWVRRKWPVGAAAAIGLAVAMVPFLDVYLPARHEVSHPAYQTVLAIYGVHLHDVVNAGKGNVFWGHSLRHLLPALRVSGNEQDYAVTPILLAAAVVGSIVAVWLSCRRDRRLSARAVGAAAAAASAVVLSLLPVRFHFGSLWIVLWHLPGGSAIRAIDRIGIVTAAMAITAVVAAGAELWAVAGSTRGSIPLRAGLVTLLALIVVEQVNTQITSVLNRPAELAFITSIPRAPAGCKSFYVTDATRPNIPFFIFQLDAMFAAQKLGLPTMNGYTGYNPPGWALNSPASAYDAGVDAWIRTHDLRHVCSLDLADMAWTPPT